MERRGSADVVCGLGVAAAHVLQKAQGLACHRRTPPHPITHHKPPITGSRYRSLAWRLVQFASGETESGIAFKALLM